jgi:phenylalanyl-tRNA synthetase beta chain
MQLHAKQSTSDNKESNIIVSVPPTRSDVLHPCDVMEVLAVISLMILGCILDLLHICFTDKASLFWFYYLQDVAIAYGFNAIMEQAIVDNKGSKRLAASLTLLPLNELSDLIRIEV